MAPDSIRKNDGKPQIRKPKKKETDLPLTDGQKFLHDLQLHQVELEIQIDELKSVKHQLATLLHKYTERYDLAPVSYFILTPDGLISDLNFPGAALLGKDRSLLINQDFSSFLSTESKLVFISFLECVFTGKNQEPCEVTLLSNEEKPCSLLLSAN